MQLWRQVSLEAIFTTMWILAAILMNSEKVLWGENPMGRPLLVVAFLNMVTFVIYIQLGSTFSSKEGGQILPQLNPAVTLLQVLNGVQGPVAGLLFMLAQFLGAILAALCATELLPQDQIDRSVLGGCFGNTVIPMPDGTSSTIGFSDHKYFLIEFIFSFTFLYVMNLLTFPNTVQVLKLKWAVLYITIDIGFNVYVSAAIGMGSSGSMFNPARCLGPAVVYGQPLWERLWPAFTAPFVAAFPVALIFAIVPPDHAELYAEQQDVISKTRRWFNTARRGGDFRSTSSRVTDDPELENVIVYLPMQAT